MTTLTLVGDDSRWLLETLVEACDVTSREGERPSVVVSGKLYAGFELIKVTGLLPDEDLQPHHQVWMDELFKRRQRGYRRTAYNLAHRANQIAADKRWSRAREV